MEYSQETQRSSEEDAELYRSVKKFKDSNGGKPFSQPRKQVSYKDSLVGDIPGAYAQAFRLEDDRVMDEESDTELDEVTEGMAVVKLSKETKSRIRAPWSKALIVKVYGRTVGFNYLTFKINALWKPTARMDCVDLGKDFFLIKFSDDGDYDKVLRGGPWFIGEHFLAIKPWEPYFKASEANFTSVAVWVRLLELPIEFYDNTVLRQIGSAIGTVLRIDSYTATGSRGSYARLCIQVNLDEPLINFVKVGRLKQKIMYEGIGSLCFCCGRLGHKQEHCCYKIRTTEEQKIGSEASSPIQNSSQAVEEDEPKYGAWMLVTRRKNLVRNGRGRGTNQVLQNGDRLAKGNSDLLGSLNKDVGPSYVDNSQDSPRKKHSVELDNRQNADLINEGEIHTQGRSVENPNNLMDTNSRPSNGVKIGSEMTTSRLAKFSRSNKLARTIITKAFKRSSVVAATKNSTLLRESEKSSRNVTSPTNSFNSSSQGVGNVAQESDNSNPRRSDSTNPSSSHSHSGMVHGGTSDSREASIPNHPRQHQNWEPRSGPSSMGVNTQPTVEVPHRHSGDNRGGGCDLEQAKKTFGSAALGRIGLVGSGKASDRLKGVSINTYGELSHNENDSIPHDNPELRPLALLQGGHCGDSEVHDGLDARLDDIQGFTEEVGMEHDGECFNDA